jgi:hypothetical protein
VLRGVHKGQGKGMFARVGKYNTCISSLVTFKGFKGIVELCGIGLGGRWCEGAWEI